MSDCTYSFIGPDGKEVTIKGAAAFKAYLAGGGLSHFYPNGNLPNLDVASQDKDMAEGVDKEKFPAIFAQSVERQLPNTVLQNEPGTKRTLTEKNLAGYGREQNPAMSLGSGVGLETNQVQSIVDAIKERWTNAPEIVVAESMDSDLVPKRVRDHNEAQKSQGAEGEPEGFYYQGKVYIIADQLNSPKDVVRVLFHETLGHAGLRGVFGDALKGVLRQVAISRRALVKAKAEQYGLDVNNDSELMQAAEEVLAEMAQDNPSIGFVQRAIAAIRTWLRANVPAFKDMELSDEEIVRNFLEPARGFIERGSGNADGALSFSRSAMKSVDANIKRGLESLARALDERTTVHRAMFRNGLGWVDFVWGSEGLLKPSGKTKGAMGLSHIIEARQRKDGLSAGDLLKLLERIIHAVASGKEIRRSETGGVNRVIVEHRGVEATLVKKAGSNAWLLSGWEVKNPDDFSAANVATESTLDGPTTSQPIKGAGFSDIVKPLTENVNINDEPMFSRRSTDEAMDFTLNGTAEPETLVDALKARNAQEVQAQLDDKWANTKQWLNDKWADAMGPVKRWAEGLDAPDSAKREIVSGLYRGTAKRDALQHEAKSLFGDKILEGIAGLAKKTNLDAETTQRLVGYWLTANYAPKANDWLIQKDRDAVAMTAADLVSAQADATSAKLALAAINNPNTKVGFEAMKKLEKAEKALEAATSANTVAEQDLKDRIASVNNKTIRGVKHKRGVAGGLTNAQAALMKANIEKRIPLSDIQGVADEVYKLMDWKLKLDLKEGKVDAASMAKWPKHKDYVPLTGSPFMALDEDVFGTGSSIPNVSKDQAMGGRTDSVADDGISAVWREISKSATHAGFQDFKRALNGVYEDAVLTHGGAREAAEVLGLSRTEGEGMTRTGDDAVIYRNGGRNFVFRFDDKAVIEAIKAGNVENTNWLMEMAATPLRWFSRMATQFNITFAPINMARDVWEKSENLRARDLGNGVDGDKVGRTMISLAFSPAVHRATWASAFGRPVDQTDKFAVALSELQIEGGISTWGEHFASKRKDLKEEIEWAGKHKVWSTKGLMNAVEGWNNSFELVSSLASYMALREAGLSKKEAAYQSLDLMNFRKQGEYMAPVRALFAFSQPIVTGGAALAKTLGTRKGQARFAAYAVMGGVLYAMLRGMAGDDDEAGNKLDNLSSFVLDRSIPIPFGDGVLKIPVGFGLPQLAWGWATNAVKMMAGEQTPTEALTEMTVRTAVKTFSPIQPSDISASKDTGAFVALSVTPTLGKPMMQLALNKTAFGAPIESKFIKTDVYKSDQGRDQTAEFYKDVATNMRELGIKDMTPEAWKVMVEGFAVGPLRTLLQASVTNPNKERLGKSTDVPVLSAFYQNYNESAARTKFYAALESTTELKQRRNAGGAEFSDVEQAKLKWADAWAKEAQALGRRKSDLKKQQGLAPEVAEQRRADLAKARESAEARALLKWRVIEGKATAE